MEIIESIELVFENCEIYKLFPEMFKCLHIQGITEELWINSYQYQNGETKKYKHCQELYIIINERGLNSITRIGIENIETLKTRLKMCKDITMIVINYENRQESIYVPWNEEDEHSNKYQTIKETEDGIEVRISKEMEV